MVSDQTAYILAETMEERVAVGMQKFYRLWLEAHGPGTLPDVTSCQKFIKAFVHKEASVYAYDNLHAIQDEVSKKRDSRIANDIILDNAGVDAMLLLEHL